MFTPQSTLTAALVASLRPIFTTTIGRGVLNPHKRKQDRSKYIPHQGKREIARRLRQQEKKS